MTPSITRAILHTLAYADVFDYPLTTEELWRYLISLEIVNKTELEWVLKSFLIKRKLSENAGKISKRLGFYFFSGRESIVQKRIKREEESRRKRVIARRFAKILSNIPTIEFIGITGALAMNNSNKDDDVDFFLVTSKNTLWITRLCVLLLLELVGARRGRKDVQVSDTICVNMMITEDALMLPSIKKDLYSAHEIVQIVSVFDRSNILERFISKNLWVKKYLPNGVTGKKLKNTMVKRALFRYSIVWLLGIFEEPARRIQMWYIKKHITTEIISDSLVAFHPFDYRRTILSEYKKRIKKYDV